jgi:hypothetical protein
LGSPKRQIFSDTDDLLFFQRKAVEDDYSKIPYEEAILKSQQNPKNPRERFLAYFAPTVDAVTKLIRRRQFDDEDEEDNETYEYAHMRDFEYKQHAADAENPLLYVNIREDEGAAFYHVLGDRMALTRKRAAVSR